MLVIAKKARVFFFFFGNLRLLTFAFAYITRRFSDGLNRVLDEFLSLCFYAETIDFWLGKLIFSLVVIFILKIQKPSDKIKGLKESRKEKHALIHWKNLSRLMVKDLYFIL